jgi:signal transduction histidine kinase/ActR/RegA family two-component response regulator
MRGSSYTSVAILFLGAAWIFSILALAALLWRGLRTILDVWLAVVMCAWVFDIALSAVFNGGRYDLGFYLGRGYGLLAASFVLIVVLFQTSGLFSQLAEKSEALKGETLKLRGDVRQGLARQQETEAQLRQAQKMEAIGNLTGGMAHDFNNLLAVVIGNLDILVSAPQADAEVQELGKEALDAALQGADLTRRLLAFARRQPLQPQIVDLNELVQSHAKLLRRLLGASIEVFVELAPDAWPTLVDRTQLESALTNLATNARDAMPNGGRLSIRTVNRYLDADYIAQFPEVSAGRYVAIEVSDTGTGIPPEVLQKVFEPFFTTKEPGKGSGLGLSMIYGFMKQTKGHVNVYSEPGVGTTFRLYLPPATSEVAAQNSITAASEPRGQGEVVLAVEDVPQLRRVAVRQLTDLGYRTLEADSVDAALAVLEKQRVDIVFTDIIMPGGRTGFDLADAARQRWPSVPVIFTSGFADAKPASGRSQTAKILSKPFRRADLAKALREALDGQTVVGERST